MYILAMSNNSIDYIALWDSIAQNALWPKYIDAEWFNYAFQWENIVTTDFKLQYLQEQNVSIGLVLLEIGFGRFNQSWVDQKIHWDNVSYLYHKLWVSPNQLATYYDNKLSTMVNAVFPMVWNWRSWWYLLRTAQLTVEEWWIKQTKVMRSPKNIEPSKDLATYIHISKLAKQHFLSLLETVKEMDADLILIIYPTLNKVVWDQSEEKALYLKEITELAEGILWKNQVQLLDYYTLLDGCVSCFMDWWHANWSWAKIISQAISDDLFWIKK